VHARRACSLLPLARLLGAVALLAVPVPLSGQGPGGERAAHRAVAAWGTEQGLPSSIVLGVQQTPDGYLWLATYEGLVRFDGVRFHTFGYAELPGLRRGSFIALAVDSAGALWAASESGELVRRERRGRWTVFDADDGLPPDRISALRLDRDGGLWVGSRLGVWRMAGGRATPLPPPRGMAAPAVIALAQDADGALWIGTVADGLLRYHQGAYTRLTTRDGLPSDRIDALHADPDGTLWVGFYGGSGVTRIRRGEITNLGRGDPTAPRRVRWFLRDRAGTLWLGAENGLFTLRGERMEAVPLEAGGTTKVEALFQDAEGSVWVGSRQSGLFRVRDASVTTLATADGLPHPFAFAVDGDGSGGVWIGTRDGVVHRPTLDDATGAERYTARDGRLPDHAVRDLMRDSAGNVWIATTGGLTRVPAGGAGSPVTFTSHDGLADDRARVLAIGRGGAVWIGTFDGVSEWRDRRLRSYGPADGLTDGYVLSVFEDAGGTLWVGTQSAGLFRRPPGEGARFVPGPAALRRQPIFRITEEADGTLWVGTTRGLARVRGRGDGASVAFVTARQGLPGNTVFQALDDGRGALWLNGPWGIARVRLAELHAVADGRAGVVTAMPFGRGDGLVAREGSSIGRSWRAPDGTLWFPTPAGVAVVDPGRLAARTAVPTAFVEEVVADGVVSEPAPTAPLVLAPGTGRLEFRFTAPSFVAPEQLRFRYRLEGFEGEWQYADTRRVASYTHLPPGDYRFLVQARAADVSWDELEGAGAAGGAAAAVAIRLRPHLWERPWFLALLALAVGTAGTLWYRVRVRAVTLASAQAAREQVLRTMSLRDELTGLYNRRGLLTLAEQQVRVAARERRGFTLLFADLDGLKAINDRHGHAAGDRAIVDAAALLRATFREADVIARLGGDEFVVLLPDAADVLPHGDRPASAVRDAARLACERVVDALAAHEATTERPFRLAFSLGTSRFEPETPRSFEAVLDDADRGMYADKRTKRLDVVDAGR
jgi:diguanylate cyclase (GGDEF)-like protein